MWPYLWHLRQRKGTPLKSCFYTYFSSLARSSRSSHGVGAASPPVDLIPSPLQPNLNLPHKLSVSCRVMRLINVEQQALPSIKAPLPSSSSLASHVISARVSSSCAYELSQLVPSPLSRGLLIPCPPPCACDLQALSLGPFSKLTVRGRLNNHEGADIFSTKSPKIYPIPISKGKGTHLFFLTVA